MTKILVTGSSGFVGQHLECIPHTGYDIVDGFDILNEYQLETAFANNHIDTVIHLAALAGVQKSLLFPNDYIDTNIKGTLNVINACKRHKVKHLIFFSSSSVYGNGTRPLFGHKFRSPAKETDELKPISPYGISKIAGELLVKSSGVPYTIIRPFSLYGDLGRKDQVFYKWINEIKETRGITLFGDGNASRGFTNVYDLVNAVQLCLKIGAENETYNIGGKELVKMSDIITELKKELTFEVNQLPENNGDIYESIADISKARERLGYEPYRIFAEELKKIIETNK